MKGVSTELVSDTKEFTRFVVKFQGRTIGILEKFTTTRTETHPWKAFKGFGLNIRYLGAFYNEDGGKRAAIMRIVEAWNA